MPIYDRLNQFANAWMDLSAMLSLMEYHDFVLHKKRVGSNMVNARFLREWLRGEMPELTSLDFATPAIDYHELVPFALDIWVENGKCVYELNRDDFFGWTEGTAGSGTADAPWPSYSFLILLSGDCPDEQIDAVLVFRVRSGNDEYMCIYRLHRSFEDYPRLGHIELNELMRFPAPEDIKDRLLQRWVSIPTSVCLVQQLPITDNSHPLAKRVAWFIDRLSRGVVVDEREGGIGDSGNAPSKPGDASIPPTPEPTECDVLDIPRSRVIDLEVVKVGFRRSCKDERGRVRWHYRRPHTRRPPGSPLDAEKSVVVAATWVNADLMDDPSKLQASVGKVKLH